MISICSPAKQATNPAAAIVDPDWPLVADDTSLAIDGDTGHHLLGSRSRNSGCCHRIMNFAIAKSTEMFKVEEAGRKAGKEIANVYREGRIVGSASITFIEWMRKRVPEHQLLPEQMALIRWYENR
jgi:hypothetical protein